MECAAGGNQLYYATLAAHVNSGSGVSRPGLGPIRGLLLHMKEKTTPTLRRGVTKLPHPEERGIY